MLSVSQQLWHDENGFLISAELVLVGTIAILSMVVGLAEVAHGVNQELEDVGTAFGAVNQSFRYSGVTGHKAAHAGSGNHDSIDFCDGECDIVCNGPIRGEW